MQPDLPKGFGIGITQANFKYKDRPDLGVIFSEQPCVYAALFTRNSFAAAPVQIDRQILKNGNTVRAIVGNAGQANACTGDTGLKNCKAIQEQTANLLGIKSEEVLLISTGVIGALFDMAKWEKALPDALADLGRQDAKGFTSAIRTTDAFLKYAAKTLEFAGGEVRLAVMAKGAGMICPNMATMLCVCITDVKVDRDVWQKMFNDAADRTFNRVSVDGDTSTNDSIIGLANGMSGVELDSRDENIFKEALIRILAEVAYKLVQDGEGASRVLNITVNGALTPQDAKLAARAIANSQLVKTAIYGGDANWGRIINAVGYSGAMVEPTLTSLKLCGIERFRAGQPVNDDLEEQLAQKLKERDIQIDLDLGMGSDSYNMLASDLGHEYVTLNSDYRS